MEVIFTTPPPEPTPATQLIRRPKKPTNRRSKSCKTCARRRVKCDGVRPFCNRCKRGVFKCDGYEPDFLWIEEAPQPRESGKEVGQFAQTPNVSNLDFDLSAIEFYSSAQRRHVPPEVPLEMPRNPSSMFSTCLENGSLLIDTLWGWQVYPAASSGSQDATELALRACALSYWGSYHHDETLVAQASDSYGAALKTLSGSLMDMSQGKEIVLLRASLALAVYEIISVTTPVAWMQHAEGLGRLLQARGPDIFKSPSDMHVFAPISTLLILKHDIDRQRCFLEEPQWQLKFQNCDLYRKATLWPISRAVMSFIPGLIEDLDAVRLGFQSGIDVSVQEWVLRDRIIETLRGLFDWHRQWRELNPDGAFEVQMDPLDSFNILPSSGQLIFEKAIHFRSISSANALTYYNASVLRVLQIAENLPTLEVSIGAALPDAGPYLAPGICGQCIIIPHPLLTKEEVALELARSVPYELLPEHRKTGAFSLMWPLRNCWLALDAASELREWVEHVLQGIAENETFELCRNVTVSARTVLQDLRLSIPIGNGF